VNEDTGCRAAVADPASAPSILPGLSAVVPVYDEVEALPAVVAALLAVPPPIAADLEVIVVDDGSRDGTGALADRLAATDSRVRVVHHERNRGYGAALRSGITAARLDYVFLTDGDGQFDLAEIARVAPLARAHDIVAGYRARRADPWRRRMAGRVWNALVRHLFGIPLRDVNCAFKLFRRDRLQSVRAESTGALISAELVAQVLRQGGTLVEVPVTHLPRRHGRATGGSVRVALRAMVEAVRLRRRVARERVRAPVAEAATENDRAACN
jgi:glycosyltransferase involved in cell wall biosynthesis